MIQKTLLRTALAVAVLASSSQAQLPGGKIAYLSANFRITDTTTMLSGTISVMDPDGGNAIKLAQANVPLSHTQPWLLYPITWSPDGTQLAYQAENDIYVVSVAGGVPVNLTNAGPDEINQHPAWSPDGRHIAFASTRGNPGLRSGLRIYLMNADGSNLVKLTEGQAESPSWSPDGHRIAFRSTWAGGGLNHIFANIFAMNADGTDPIQLTHETTIDCGATAWSPDGRRIAFDMTFRKSPTWHSEVDVMDLDGGNRVRVSEVPGVEKFDNESPSWSPDGSKIVFMSDRRHHFDIWMVNPDGTVPVRVSQVAASEDDQMFPAWSPAPRLVTSSAVRALSWGEVKGGGW